MKLFFPRFDRLARGLATATTVLLVLASSASAQVNLRLVPDERATLSVTVVLTNDVPIRGGEIGLAYDASVARVMDVALLPGLHPDTMLFFDLDPATDGCRFEEGIDRGLSIAWINPVGTDSDVLTPSGDHGILRISFATADGAGGGATSPLRFTSCLGVPEAPVRNVVSGADGRSRPAVTSDSSITLESSPFVRGDANIDGTIDIGDAVTILGILFGGRMVSPCEKAADADDSAQLNITDAVFLLRHLFSGGEPPPAPYTECGPDPTADALGCESFDICA